MLDECKTHLCFEFISHVINSIYIHIHVKLLKFPLNLVCRILDEKQVISQEMSNIFLQGESTGCLTACHWEDDFFYTI